MLRWSIIGFGLGLLVALAPSCGSTGTQCLASNCTGCCASTGTCQAGSSASVCGAGAVTCQACLSGQSCQSGVCAAGNGDGGSCSASSCTGCCSSTWARCSSWAGCGCGTGSGRANATGVSLASDTGFFNPAAFTIPPLGQFGNAGRNTIPGPDLFSVNMGFGRAFAFDESRRRFEVRMEANNVFNHVNYTNVNTVVNAINAGTPISAASMRTVGITARFRF